MGKQENIKIFEDTETLCKTNSSLKQSIKNSICNQKLILQNQRINSNNQKRYEKPANIIVSKKRTLQAASAYKNTKTAVHNFASATNPGGGVKRGSNAQEECLCRCSGLYVCLSTQTMLDGFYSPHRQAHNPIYNDDIIYTPAVKVFKTDTAQPEIMNASDWYDVDVITCAAPNLRVQNNYNGKSSYNNVKKMTNEELLKLHEKRLKRILDIALSENNETIILGAFGCGAFKNDPQIVAQAAKNVIREYLYSFKNIEFAVYCSPRDDRNYRIFDRVLKK